MVVGVKVKLQSATGEVVTAALANSGFEANELEVILPTKVAERFGIWKFTDDEKGATRESERLEKW